jgi:hypothetical protein
MPEMSFTSPLSAEHNGAFSMQHGLTDRTLHDIHDLIGAGILTDGGHSGG